MSLFLKSLFRDSFPLTWCVWFVAVSRLDRHSGELFVNGRIVSGEFNFRVKVYDVIWRYDVTSTVTVHVKEISDDVVLNSGSVRLHGLYINCWHCWVFFSKVMDWKSMIGH